MSDVTRRLEAWQAKFSPDKVMATLTARREAMARRYEAAIADLCTMESEVKQVLDGLGAPTLQYVYYLDYARQLFRLTRRQSLSGASFDLESQVLLQKWGARGLDPAILAKIRKDVFSADPPSP